MRLLSTTVAFVAAIFISQVTSYEGKTKPVFIKDIPTSMSGGKIVGGQEAIPHAWPHQVALFIDLAVGFCGGFIISEDWILTAAHCAEIVIPSITGVMVGVHKWSNNSEGHNTFIAGDVIVHENWNRSTVANDIGLIKMKEPLVFSDIVQPCTLATERPPVGTIVTPTGWGKTRDGILAPPSEVLMQVDVPVYDQVLCEQVYGSDIIQEGILCTDGADGKGTCQGDSGGPLNYDGTVVGITSFGAAAGCTQGYPEGFTNVPYYIDWIEANTGLKIRKQ